MQIQNWLITKKKNNNIPWLNKLMKNDLNICERLKILLYSKNRSFDKWYRSVIIVKLVDVVRVNYDLNEIIDYYKIKYLLKDNDQKNPTRDTSKFRLIKQLSNRTQINFVSGPAWKISNSVSIFIMWFCIELQDV